jgi:hypothetical protein
MGSGLLTLLDGILAFLFMIMEVCKNENSTFCKEEKNLSRQNISFSTQSSKPRYTRNIK